MADITKAVFDRMVNDAELVSLIAQFEAEPAVFTDERVPPDSQTPYIHSHGNTAGTPFDTKLERAIEIYRDITIIVDQGNQDLLERLETRVYQLFHRHSLVISGGRTMIAAVSGPTPAPTDAYVIGSVMTLRLRFELT